MNTIIKQIMKIFSYSALVAVILFVSAPFAYADVAPPLAEFSSNPLFEKINFMPGDSAVGDIVVNNRYDETKRVIAEGVNVLDEGLGEVLDLVITENGEPVYEGHTLGEFLSSGEVFLSELDSFGSVKYIFTVTFAEDIEEHQGETLGFDICIGFEGGDQYCGDTVISNEDDTDGGEDSGEDTTVAGSGSSGGGGTYRLQISDEHVEEKTVASGGGGTALIVWETNLLATSQVVYGPASDSYSLDIYDDMFGYPLASLEDSIKVQHHEVLLTDLDVNITYKYRVISRASPATVSYQHMFTVDSNGVVTEVEDVQSVWGAYEPAVTAYDEPDTLLPGGDSNTSLALQNIAASPAVFEHLDNVGSADGDELGVDELEIGGSVELPLDIPDTDLSRGGNTASVFGVFPSSLDEFTQCIWKFVLILILIYIFVLLLSKFVGKKDKKSIIQFWIYGTGLSLVVVYLMNILCVLTPLGILLIGLSGWLIVEKK